MKRTTIFLPDELHEALRQEAFRKHLSMAELIRSRLRSISRTKRQLRRDPLAKVEGLIQNGGLSQGIDEALYGQ